jgi:hypothetical protein
MSNDYKIDDVIYFFMHTLDTSNVPTDVVGFDRVVYENSSTTEITAGFTSNSNHDSVTGLSVIEITLSAAHGYEAGKDYHVVASGGTVDSVSIVGRVIGRFSIERVARLSATEVIPELTHYCDGVTSRSIISLNANFAGTLALAPDIGNATISTVNSALLTGAASVTGTSLSTDKSQKQALYTVAALSTTGTYTATVSVTTTDSQTLVSTGTIVVT